MADNVKEMNLNQRLSKIRGICDAVKKSKQGYGYSYADISDILAKVTAGMSKYEVSLVPKIVPQTAKVEPVTTVNTKFDKTGKAYDNTVTEMLFSADMVFEWICDDTGENRQVPWFVTGSQSDPSQAMGSGLTYTQRQFLTNYFQIAQDNDVDGYRSKQKEAEASEDKAVAEEIITTFDSLIRQYLADHEDKKEEVAKFVKKFAKNGNYNLIKEPALASKLLEDFKSKFIEEGGK